MSKIKENFNNNYKNLFVNSNIDLNQEDNEDEDIKNSIENLSIKSSDTLNLTSINEINDKIDSKSFLNSKNLSIDLFSSQSTEFSNIINFQLSHNTEKIYEKIYEKNIIKNSIIISDDEETYREIYIKIIEDLYTQNSKNLRNINKICFLIVDSKKINKLFVNLNEIFGKQKKIVILQGGKGKKMKNDYNKFDDFFQNNDIFISIPDVLYKLLSIGFIKVEQFNILFIDDCHLCEGNHPYNVIMQEFYYYYIYRKNKLGINTIYSLPNIIGFTDLLFIDKRIINNNNKCKQLLENISENLDCQIIISPKILYNNNPFKENNIYIEYIQVINNLDDKNNYENYKIIYDILHHYFFSKMFKLCLKNFLYKNQNISIEKEKLNQMYKYYMEFTQQKFFSNNYEEYMKIETNNNNLPFLSKSSYLFQIFEEMQKYLIIILQNIDLQGVIHLLDNYLIIIQNFMIKKEKEQLEEQNTINEMKQLIIIVNDTINAFKNILQKKFNFYNYRLNKFLSFLKNIYSKEKNTKIIIFVPSRKIAYALNEYLNRKNAFKSEYIAGINSKNDDSFFFSISTKFTNNIINERNQKFINEEINILICTPSVYDIIKIKKCEYIIIYNELSNSNYDYIKIKNFAFYNDSKLIIFTLDQHKIRDILMQKVIEHDNKFMIFFEQNKIVKDFRCKNYLEKKIENIEKQIYYIIEETQAKVSIKNSMMLFNEINNWFLQQNKKLINTKFIDEIYIDKIKKYKCKIELSEMFKGTKIFSHIFADKQTSEAECILQLILFLYKFGLIDNNFKIIEKLK